MLVRLASDLHWEFTKQAQHQTRLVGTPYPEFWVPSEMPNDKDTVLVLAGDLYLGLKSIPIVKTFNERFKAVLIVLGNHDYYGTNIHTFAQDYKVELNNQGLYNVYLLDREVVKFDDVVFIGSTLWTNMNKEDPLTVMHAPQYMIPDFNQIGEGYNVSEDYMPSKKLFKAETWLDINYNHFDYIKTLVEMNKDEKVCIVTHHGCTFEAVAEQFKNESIGNGYFFSEYSDFILDHSNIKAWLHGHTHTPVDLMIGDTKVIANPFGYPREHLGFDEYLTITI